MISLLCAILKISGKRKVLKSRFETKISNRKGLISLLLSYSKGNVKLFVKKLFFKSFLNQFLRLL